jgi:hypothetical protein
MGPDRVTADLEPTGDGLGGEPVGDQREDLSLAGGELGRGLPLATGRGRVGVVRDEDVALEDRPHGAHEVVGRDVLVQVAVEPRAEGLAGEERVRTGGHRDHLGLGSSGEDLLAELEAGDGSAGHVDQDQVRGPLVHCPEGITGGDRHDRIRHPGIREGPLDRLGEQAVLVDDEGTGHRLTWSPD